MEVCELCRYSVKVEGDPNGYLECHRHAIAAVGIDDDGEVVSAFPVCEPGMWCGEFQRVPRVNAPNNYAAAWE